MNEAAFTHESGLFDEGRDIADGLLVGIEYDVPLGLSPLEGEVVDAVAAEVVGYLPGRAVNYVRDVIDDYCVDVLASSDEYFGGQLISDVESVRHLVCAHALRKLLIHLSNLTIICCLSQPKGGEQFDSIRNLNVLSSC